MQNADKGYFFHNTTSKCIDVFEASSLSATSANESDVP